MNICLSKYVVLGKGGLAVCWDDVVVLFIRTFVICNVGIFFPKVGGRGRGFFSRVSDS